MGWEGRENRGMGTEVLLRMHLLPSLPTSSKTQVALGLMQQHCSTCVQRAISDRYLLPMPPECLRTPTPGTVCTLLKMKTPGMPQGQKTVSVLQKQNIKHGHFLRTYYVLSSVYVLFYVIHTVVL